MLQVEQESDGIPAGVTERVQRKCLISLSNVVGPRNAHGGAIKL